MKPQPSSDELIGRMLNLLLDRNDPERSYVAYSSSDAVVLFVNNMGGMSTLEMGAVVDEALTHLERSAKIVPVRIYNGSFMTTLNAIGFSLSLLNVTQIAQEVCITVDKVLDFLDAPHASANWPSRSAYPVPENLAKRTREEKFIEVPKAEKLHENVAKGQLFGASISSSLSSSGFNSIINSLFSISCGSPIGHEICCHERTQKRARVDSLGYSLCRESIGV